MQCRFEKYTENIPKTLNQPKRAQQIVVVIERYQGQFCGYQKLPLRI